jgi:putative phosphoesterase
VKIGVFSDSHDNVNMIKMAVDLFNVEGVELVIHAGDFIAPFAVAAMSDLNCKVIGVFGNNDGERIGVAKRFESLGEVHNNLAEVEVGSRKICAMHYPELAEAIAQSGEYDIVIYGHTHQIDARQEKSLILNPGEVGGWVTGKSTVAIVDLDNLEVEIREL